MFSNFFFVNVLLIGSTAPTRQGTRGRYWITYSNCEIIEIFKSAMRSLVSIRNWHKSNQGCILLNGAKGAE